MLAKFVLGFLLLVVLNVLSLGLAQNSISVIENLDRYSEIQALTEGDMLSTSVIVCNDRAILLAILESMQSQADVSEPLLSDELQTEMQESCWINSQVELQFVALDETVQQLSQPLATANFVQVSDIQIVEASVSGLSLNGVHSIAGETIALAGTFAEVTREAYFLVLEAVSISKQ